MKSATPKKLKASKSTPKATPKATPRVTPRRKASRLVKMRKRGSESSEIEYDDKDDYDDDFKVDISGSENLEGDYDKDDKDDSDDSFKVGISESYFLNKPA